MIVAIRKLLIIIATPGWNGITGAALLFVSLDRYEFAVLVPILLCVVSLGATKSSVNTDGFMAAANVSKGRNKGFNVVTQPSLYDSRYN